AIKVLDELIERDPRNEKAAWLRALWRDMQQSRSARDAAHTRTVATRDLLISDDGESVPYRDDLRYPADWAARSVRRGFGTPHEMEAMRRARQRLLARVSEIRFDALDFEGVINRLRAMTGLNFVVNWKALAAVGVERDVPVSLALRDVSYQKLIDLALSEV